MLKRVLAALLVLPGVLALYLTAALIGAFLPGTAPARPGPVEVEIGLLAGPIHYDFLLPLTPDLRARFAFTEAAGVPVMHPNAEWLVVGWGARDFYTSVGSYGDVTARATWRGITGDSSVMRVSAAGALRDPGTVVWLALSRMESEALLTAIEASFARDANGLPRALGPSGPSGAFFEGTGRFHIWRTCNVWVGEVLRAAGLRFGAWTPTPYAVRLSLWRFARQ